MKTNEKTSYWDIISLMEIRNVQHLRGPWWMFWKKPWTEEWWDCVDPQTGYIYEMLVWYNTRGSKKSIKHFEVFGPYQHMG